MLQQATYKHAAEADTPPLTDLHTVASAECNRIEVTPDVSKASAEKNNEIYTSCFGTAFYPQHGQKQGTT